MDGLMAGIRQWTRQFLGDPPTPHVPAPPLREPWRHITRGQTEVWHRQMEQDLRDECLRADLELLGQRQVRILVLGATGSGKSSFIRSLYSALTDQVRQYTYTAASSTSVTKFLQHPPLRIRGSTPCFRIQDAPGIMEVDEDFYTDFVTLALQGHLREGVEIPPGRISTSADHYVEFPGEMDRPCLVVFVLGSLPLNPNSVLRRKLDIAMEQASRNRIKLAIVLTKADLLSAAEERTLKNADVQYIFRSQAVLKAVRKTSSDTGLPQNTIFPVTNYTEQTETCTEMNIVLLYTLSKLLSDAKLEAENRLEAERAAGPENPD